MSWRGDNFQYAVVRDDDDGTILQWRTVTEAQSYFQIHRGWRGAHIYVDPEA